MTRLGREVIYRYIWVLGEEIVKSVVIGNIKLVPIVKSGALELRVVDLKAERTNKVKRSPRSGAGAVGSAEFSGYRLQ